jgi:hypothetical protein
MKVFSNNFIMNRSLRIFLATLLVALIIRPAAASDFATDVMNATFKFYDPDSTATCFLVRREPPDTANYLITAAHVIEDVKGRTAVLVLRTPKADGSFARRDYTITIRTNGRALWVRHKTEDVAVLRLTAPLPVPVAALPESVLADEARFQQSGVHICSPLFVLTYPARLEANDAAFPIARRGIFASAPLLPMPVTPSLLPKSTKSSRPVTFLADFTTFAGDSGGPVFIESADGSPLIVGIVLGRTSQDLKHQDEYGEALVHYPLGLGTILHAQCVRDTLDAAAKPVAAAPKSK